MFWVTVSVRSAINQFTSQLVQFASVEQQMDPATVSGLSARGHRVEVINDSYQDFGAGQFIWRLGDPAKEG